MDYYVKVHLEYSTKRIKMMKSKYRVQFSFLLVLALTMISGMLIAQDQIIITNSEVIDCTIEKITTTAVEYIDAYGVKGSIKKDKVSEIVFGADPRNPIDYSNDSPNCFKINVYSLVHNAVQLSFEHAIDPVSSIEFTAKLYGVGFKDFVETKLGGAFEVGYRFRIGDVISAHKKPNYTHVLDGIGIKPVAGFSYGDTRDEGLDKKYYYFQMGTILNYQAVLANKFLFELYGGLHIYKGKSTVYLPNSQPITGVLKFVDGDLDGEDNVAYSYGIKLGYMFGSFDTDKKMLRW